MTSRLFTILKVTFVSSLFLISACSRNPLAKKELETKDIGIALAPTICEKYASCNQSPEFNKEQCIKDLSTGIPENLKNNPEAKIDQAKLDACTESLKKATCEEMGSAIPPPNCEFLQ